MATFDTGLAIGPLDGRYRRNVSELADIFSEQGLVKNRVMIEVNYFIRLVYAYGEFDIGPYDIPLCLLYDEFKTDDYSAIKVIERRVNHDVKAVEYWIREKALALGLPEGLCELIHLALTSEDVNNLAYSLQVVDGLDILHRALHQISHNLDGMAHLYAETAMMARTHGQPATPTTFGKEMRVFYHRIMKVIHDLETARLLGKMNGATGTYAAHLAADPTFNWKRFCDTFVSSLGFIPSPATTQIESHDSVCRVFSMLISINNILLDLARDMWLYIAFDMVKLKINPDEVGSSTMPHKVNPIDFENAEGNLLQANALFESFIRTLPISRLQRDLSDSTTQRSIGVAFGYSLQAYKSLIRGLNKVEPDSEYMLGELRAHPELLAEAIQTVLRVEGVPNGYELVKELTRGQSVTLEDIHRFVDTLQISEEARDRLKQLRPETYTGLAAQIARNEL